MCSKVAHHTGHAPTIRGRHDEMEMIRHNDVRMEMHTFIIQGVLPSRDDDVACFMRIHHRQPSHNSLCDETAGAVGVGFPDRHGNSRLLSFIPRARDSLGSLVDRFPMVVFSGGPAPDCALLNPPRVGDRDSCIESPRICAPAECFPSHRDRRSYGKLSESDHMRAHSDRFS